MSGRRFERGASFAVRVPLLPLETVTDARATGDGSDVSVKAQRAWLVAVIERADVREALYVASPALHGEIDVWRAAPDSAHGRKIEQSLVKYVTRMATRATPYGLCAGICSGRIDGRGVELAVSSTRMQRRTRIDNEVLFRLADVIASTAEARERLAWSPNTSLARVAGRWRYAEARAGEAQALRYHLVAVEPTPYLDATIERARGGARLAALAEALAADEGVELDEARAYVDELVTTQVLVPSLGVQVTGTEPIDGLIAQLHAAGLDASARALAGIRGQLEALDDGGGDVAAYDAIAAAIARMFDDVGAPSTLERARLFQVDALAPVAGRLGRDVVSEIERAADALGRMTPRREDPRLVEMRRAFRERWEDREIPLADVLDEEAGIGFSAPSGPGSEGSPLLAGVPFAPRRDDSSTAWGARERWLLRRLAEEWASGGDELVLGQGDIQELSAATAAELPVAWSVLTRVARAADGELRVLVEDASGPSGARLLGRFCHVDGGIEAMVREHLEREAAAHPGVLLAEVAHLAEGRTGNILCRPVLRSHEIVYLGRSGAPGDAQVTLDDLMMSVRGDRIVLRSRRLGREVVPRLTSAHNVATHGLGVYRFLAALQNQDGMSVGWTWGALADAPRLPRVRIGHAVVARACWRIDGGEIRELTRAARVGRRDGFAAVQLLRTRRVLPRHVVVTDSDNELWIDLDHALQVDAMLATISGREHATLTEVWPAPHDAVASGDGGTYASEIVVAFTRSAREARSPRARPRIDDAADVVRRFAPGSRWLYAKLYGGVSSADRVLREAVGPVVRDALASGAARRWFFVRYADPQPHVRVRLDGDPARLLAETLPALHAATAPLLADGALWRMQLDTYEREIERYGGPAGIELCEDIFWHDAEAALAIVEQLDGDAGAEARWQLAFVSAERLLAALGLDLQARERVLSAGKETLAAEHRAGAPLLKAIGERWRAHEGRLTELLAPGRAASPDEPLATGLTALERRDVALRRLRDGEHRPMIGEMRGEMVDGAAWSLVHMSCNRLLHASARAQELVIYEMLRRWHGRQRARALLAPEVAA